MTVNHKEKNSDGIGQIKREQEKVLTTKREETYLHRALKTQTYEENIT